MTTAARPTFEPARGGTGKGESDLSKLSKQYSSRDMPSHTKLKYRQPGQDSQEDVKSREFRRELEDRERATTSRDRRRGETSSSSSKKPRLEQASSSNIDADDAPDDDDDSDSDEDDTAELMAELTRIKKERAVEKAQQDAERQAEMDRVRTENILSGNPLLNNVPSAAAHAKADFKVKRRWDDDVVFKNCAKGLEDTMKREKYFINDSQRSEFHKKFMTKYIK